MLLSSDWEAGLTAFQTYQGLREVETTALPTFQQSIIILSLPGSHHQAIPLLIKILQPLITQLIIAVFISPGLAVQTLWGTQGFVPGLGCDHALQLHTHPLSLSRESSMGFNTGPTGPMSITLGAIPAPPLFSREGGQLSTP